MDIQQVILEKAESLFMRYGVKSISMDDVARALGISKKTLYQHFATKEELLIQTLEHNRQCELALIQHTLTHSDNALVEIVEIAKMVIRQLERVSDSLIFDLKKYHPDAFKILEDTRRTHIYEHIRRNLEKGIQQGLYLDTLDIEIMARIHVNSFNLMMDDKLFPESLPKHHIFREYILHYLRGIVTPLGLQYLEKYMHI